MTQIHHVEDMFTSQKPRSCRVFSGEAPDNGTLVTCPSWFCRPSPGGLLGQARRRFSLDAPPPDADSAGGNRSKRVGSTPSVYVDLFWPPMLGPEVAPIASGTLVATPI
jgi:hypothetical protein